MELKGKTVMYFKENHIVTGEVTGDSFDAEGMSLVPVLMFNDPEGFRTDTVEESRLTVYQPKGAATNDY